MEGSFLDRLLTPSPIMHWLLMLLPVTIAVSGIFGAAEREAGNRRIAVWALVLTLWLFLPYRIADPVMAPLGGMISILGWLGLVAFWARHVWVQRPTPVWAQGAVVTHLLAILVACVVALVRAATAAPA